LVDLSLVDVRFGHRLESIAVFQEPTLKSVVSGLLWNIAFGRSGERLFCPIQFEGASNIEGELRSEGVLNNDDLIKALCFQIYNVSRQRSIVGFHRAKDEEEIMPLLDQFCDFTNDDENSNAWRILQGNEL
jgi:hypothetical protein